MMSLRAARSFVFFFNDTATTEIYTLSLHDALPICRQSAPLPQGQNAHGGDDYQKEDRPGPGVDRVHPEVEADDVEVVVPELRRSEEHTSELQSRQYLVCRLLLEKKKTYDPPI